MPLPFILGAAGAAIAGAVGIGGHLPKRLMKRRRSVLMKHNVYIMKKKVY